MELCYFKTEMCMEPLGKTDRGLKSSAVCWKLLTSNAESMIITLFLTSSYYILKS